jgi:hypothetical protein
MFRSVIAAIMIPAVFFAGLSAPLRAHAENWDQEGGLDSAPIPQGRIQIIANDWQYLVPVRKPVGGWTSEMVVMPFVDENGLMYTATADLTQKSFTLSLAGQILGTVPISDTDVLDLRSTKLPPDGTNVVCGGLCIALSAVILGAILHGVGLILDNAYDCHQAQRIAFANQNGAREMCERTRTPDGRRQTFRLLQSANFNNTCGTPHYAQCVPSS